MRHDATDREGRTCAPGAGNCIKFLGTAGARFVMARQLRYSAGTFINFNGKQLILDPGPGTLVRYARSRPPIDPAMLDALILTHLHIDHSSDVIVMIDAMTGGGLNKRGVLFAPDESLHGENRVVLTYLRDFLDRIEVLKPSTAYSLDGLRFHTSVRHRHAAETYGIIFELDGKKISFMADTQFFPELLDSYRDSEVLVMNVVIHTPRKGSNILHLSLADVKEIVRALRPKKTILTHLGMLIVRENPRLLSKTLSDELGMDVTVATDGMTVTV
jgi:ribonuclease BN (tRNA processing enzyme)